MDIKNRKVLAFRTLMTPMIGPVPKNAFSKRELTNWEFELTPVGVYVKARFTVPGGKTDTTEHIVPYANVQSVTLEPLPPAEEGKDKKVA